MLPNKLYDSLKYFQRLNGKKKVQYAISGSAFLIIRLCSFNVMACWLIDNTVTWSCSCNPLMLARPKIYSLCLLQLNSVHVSSLFCSYQLSSQSEKWRTNEQLLDHIQRLAKEMFSHIQFCCCPNKKPEYPRVSKQSKTSLQTYGV